MRHIPMLFSPAMIKALLDDRKTETRRTRFAIKGYPNLFQFGQSDTPGYDWTFRRKDHVWEDFRHDELMRRMQTQVGDLIWVRENCQAIELENGDDVVRYPADGSQALIVSTMDAADRWGKMNHYAGKRGAVVPSIHMPKWASRLTLRVISFHIERLHDIDEAGAVAEGIERLHGGYHDDDDVYENYSGGHDFGGSGGAVSSYRTLWDSINGAGAWDANPWVSVTKFEVIRQNVSEVAV